MNLAVAIVSLFCYCEPTMKIHECEASSSQILSGDGQEGREEVSQEDHAGAAGEDAKGPKKKNYNFVDRTGIRYGMLMVLFQDDGVSKHRRTFWRCRCDCGKEITTEGNYLSSGHRKSCGCLRENQTPPHLIPEPKSGTKHIPLTGGKWAIIDEDDFERISVHKWCASGKYAHRGFSPSKYKRSSVLMHVQIFGNPPKGMEVDHKNRNGLDNRKSNLRFATKPQNGWNSGISARNTSGFKGVSFHKQQKKWAAYIVKHGKRTFLGCFKQKEDAALAYEVASRKLHGEFSRTV